MLEIRLDEWGFVFETGYLDLYVQKNTLILALVLYAAIVARRFYLGNKQRVAVAKTRRAKTEK